MWWFVFLVGLVVGSFLNVLVYRLPRGIGFIKGRSFCPKCKKKISWFDNVPVISFLILKGHCRFCGKSISLKYPLVELATGLLTVLVFKFFVFNNFFDLFLSLFLVWGLIAIFFIDLEHQIIPDEIIFPLIVIFFIWRLISGEWVFLLTALLSFLFIYFIYWITKGKGMGFGDVKFAFLMGLFLGYPKVILAFYVAFLTGAILGIILILLGKARLKQKIAFGPFLAFSVVVSYLWGEEIIEQVMVLL